MVIYQPYTTYDTPKTDGATFGHHVRILYLLDKTGQFIFI